MKKTRIFSGLILIVLILAACQPLSTPTVEIIPPTETSEPTQVVTPEPTAEPISYDGLSFDDFLEASYRDLKLRTPESYVELGLESIYGDHPVSLNDLSLAYQDETHALFQVVLESLRSYNFEPLLPEQQDSYILYENWLESSISAYDFRFNEYIDSGFDILSASGNTEFFFSDIQPMKSLADAEDYLTRLDGVATKINQISERVQASADAGIIPPPDPAAKIVEPGGNHLPLKPNSGQLLPVFTKQAGIAGGY